MYYIFFAILFIVVLIEATVTTLPLVFICLLCYLIVFKKPFVFYTALFFGILLDLFASRALGSTFVFFLLFFYLVLLYRKKYEIDSYPFVLVTSFMGSYLYGILYRSSNALTLAVISSMIAVLLFGVLKLNYGSQNSKQYFNT